jgi:magnesium transporter
MIRVYRRTDGTWRSEAWEEGRRLPQAAWIDLITPTPEEMAAVQRQLSIEIPTRAEMQEIEASSRLYQENSTYFMTATTVTGPDLADMESSAVTFILSSDYLVTVRYVTPRSFEAFAARIQKPGTHPANPPELLIALLEAMIDRIADILEQHSAEVDRISRLIFAAGEGKRRKRVDLQQTIRVIGSEGNHFSALRESIVSISRMVLYFNQAVAQHEKAGQLRETLMEISRDLASLADHASFMANKITFLLDATLGMISIQQNQIIKLFSVAAVVFLPPTLIASIYGMNFRAIPELAWELGYPMALGLMVVSAVLPFFYFKRKGWL